MWNSPASATVTAYGSQRRTVGRSSARSSSQVAAETASSTNAYARASWPYREIDGVTANSRPETSAARLPKSFRAASTTKTAVPAMASAEGSRIIVGESPKTLIQKRISR